MTTTAPSTGIGARTLEQAQAQHAETGPTPLTAALLHATVNGSAACGAESGVTSTGEITCPRCLALAFTAPSREPGDTVTLTRAALVDLLTTAAVLGRDMATASTRGDVTQALAAYGLAVRSPRLDVAVAHAITATSA